MSFARELYDRFFAPTAGGQMQRTLLTHVHGPGSPAETDAVPEFVGQEYFDTADEQWWKATGTDPGAWKRITSDNP